MDKSYFEFLDYIIFFTSLCVSISIGIYFSLFRSKQKQTEDEYLYGSKKMKAIPVGLSLYSSVVSAITILGIPSEMYYYGIQYITGSIGIILGVIIAWLVCLPIFCGNLNIKTPYEYYERRFGNGVKLMISFIHIFSALLMMPLTLYAPSMALSQVTEFPILICSTAIGVICTIYTTFGGFKTVIWTDTVQATIMIFSYLVVAIIGTNKLGGFSKIWSIAEEGGRIHSLNMDPNPFVRTTFWSSIIGMLIVQCSYSGSSAGALQRYMSLPSQNQAKISSIIGAMGIVSVYFFGGITGLVMYAQYHSCDPVLNKDVKSPNQVLPFFITRTLEYIPGFAGLFIAGLFSAALSTLSSELNVVSGMVYYDFVLKFFNNNFTKTRGTLIMKIAIIINGLIYICSVPLLFKSKHIFELSLSIGGITFGAKLGMLFLGILFPKCNSKGVIVGSLTSIAVIAWINYGALTNQVGSYYLLDTNTDNCTNSNITRILHKSFIEQKPPLEDIFILYRLSYFYYSLLGTVITIILGMIVSHLTGPKRMQDLDPMLIAPFLRSSPENQSN